LELSRVVSVSGVVLLSTTSGEDLSGRNTELLRFEREIGEEAAVLLENSNRWRVGSRSGCGCGFRHLTAPELGFAAPEEWCPEEAEDVVATGEFFSVVEQLVERGERVDCVDVWSGTLVSDIRRMEVGVAGLRPGKFRFFENHHFVFQ